MTFVNIENMMRVKVECETKINKNKVIVIRKQKKVYNMNQFWIRNNITFCKSKQRQEKMKRKKPNQEKD